MQDRIFFIACFGLVLGVLWRSFILMNSGLVVLIGVISVTLLLYFSFFSLGYRLKGEAKINWGLLIAVFLLTFSLGILRFQITAQKMPLVLNVQSGQAEQGREVSLIGIINEEPRVKENNQNLVVWVKNERQKVKILLTANLENRFSYGDEINFSGRLEEPENFTTEQGKIFDYKSYLRKDGIFYTMRYPKIEIISRGNGSILAATLFSIKEKFLEKINSAVRQPENLLLGGLILGERAPFSRAFTQRLIDTGTIHLVALSGYNVTIVAEWIMKLFSFIPRNFGIVAGLLTIFLFILMTGASSTAIRAGIMAALALFARATGRNYDAGRALLLAGVLMILFNPLLLAFDSSFQLSFLATVAVIFLAPRLEKYFIWVPKKFELRDIISVTCASYLFVLPFLLYKMGIFSLVALPANILILPFIPFTMLLGFLTGFAGLVWPVLAVPLGFISYLFLHCELGVINFFASLPFASLSLPNFPFWITLIIYIYFIYRLFGRSIKQFAQS